MTETTVSKRGRPKGTRTATVELETLSFKVPAGFKAQLQTYAKQRRHSISELIREGVEWRIGEGDPLNIRYGTVSSDETAYEGNTGNTEKIEKGVEFLHGMLSALVDEVRQLRNSVQALEQRIEDTRSVQALSVPGNTDLVSVDGDIPAASMKAQSTARQTPVEEDTRKSVDVSDRWRARKFTFDPAEHQWGKLCRNQHDRDGGQSVRKQATNECVDCRWERSKRFEERHREA